MDTAEANRTTNGFRSEHQSPTAIAPKPSTDAEPADGTVPESISSSADDSYESVASSSSARAALQYGARQSYGISAESSSTAESEHPADPIEFEV